MVSLKKIKEFYQKYERALIPGALLFGFLTDLLTFNLINLNTSMILLLGHLIFIGFNITIINFFEEKIISGKFFSYWRVLAPLFLQYSFGNLFSGFLIFYSNSGSFSASWPFFIVIIFLMIGNEIFRKYNLRLVIQISVYFFAIFSYLNLVLPYILKNITIFVFILSGIISLLAITVFIFGLSFYIFQIKEKKKNILISISSIFLAMNFLYFFNIIPPIPLSIKDIGIYHNVKRVDDNYLVKTEKCNKIDKCFFFNEKRSIETDRKTLYLYSAVHAPNGMTLNVFHQWQTYNEETKKWETAAEIPFTISGGRDIGYRWYSFYGVFPGTWRVNVKTEKGQTIGRKKFYVIKNNEAELIEIII